MYVVLFTGNAKCSSILGFRVYFKSCKQFRCMGKNPGGHIQCLRMA